MRLRSTPRIGLLLGVGLLIATAGSGCAPGPKDELTSAPDTVSDTPAATLSPSTGVTPGATETATPAESPTTSPTAAASAGWTIVASDAGLALNGVSCLGPADCWAVGQGTGTLVEHDAGSGWTTVPSPNPPAVGTNDMLEAVACTAAEDCWAVGVDAASEIPQALIEEDAGSGWAIVAGPTPPGGQFSGLYGVTCVSAVDCWAVGNYTDSAGEQVPLIEQNTGSGWSVVSSPTPPEGGGSLVGVTCAGAADCWAVGAREDAGATLGTLIEQFTGTGWTIVPSQPPSDSDSNQLNAVTCWDAGDCWAVGYDGADQQPVIEQYNGGGWSIVSSPEASGSGDFALAGVSCAGANDCWAVGGDNMTGSPQSLIEQNTGGGWTIVEAPDPATGSRLTGLSCPSSSVCWAVGASGLDDEAGVPGSDLIEQYS